MTEKIITLRSNECLDRDANYARRTMTESEIETVKRAVSGYSNVTVTGVVWGKKEICVNFAENYQTKNHREHQIRYELSEKEWTGWY